MEEEGMKKKRGVISLDLGKTARHPTHDVRESLVLLDEKYKKRGKKQVGRQEWITAIECASASEETLPPTLILKGKIVNLGWIQDSTPPGWAFSQAGLLIYTRTNGLLRDLSP
jgi:hypothetical protein